MTHSGWISCGAAVFLGIVLAACGGGGGGGEVQAPAEKPAPPAPAATVDAASAAKLTGKVLYQGPEPKAARIKMDAEPACAKVHTEPVYAQEIVINPDGTLQNALVYVKEGLPESNYPTPSQAATIDQKGCVYSPHVVAVMTNQEIAVRNSDPTTHNIHPLPKQNREWNKSQPPGGEPLKESFAREEIAIPVKCNVHPWMKSYIAVLKHPFFVVTGRDGSFNIEGLPPGEYTVAVWHEKLGTMEKKVTVAAKETGTVEFTFTGAGGA